MTSSARLALATFVTAASCLLGCAAEADSADDGDSTMDDYRTKTNAETAYRYFLAKGLTRVQAAAIVGNLRQESGMDPNAVQPHGKGRGIAQWSVGERWDGPGSDSLRSFAARSGRSMHDLQVQLDFIWFELDNYDHYGLDALRRTSTITPAVYSFQRDFEACGDCESGKRIAYAREVLAAD